MQVENLLFWRVWRDPGSIAPPDTSGAVETCLGTLQEGEAKEYILWIIIVIITVKIGVVEKTRLSLKVTRIAIGGAEQRKLS